MGWLRSTGLVIAAVLLPASALGQSYYAQETGVTGPIVWNMGGTLMIPVSDSSDRTGVGGGFTLGLTFNPAKAVGVQLEYSADWAGLETGQLAGAGIGGDTFLQYFDLNLQFRPISNPRSGLYLLAGGGLYYRAVDITRYEGTVLAPYCDPYLFYCTTVPVAAESVLGSRSSWDYGLDAGIGFVFGVTPPIGVYLEVRYHYIFGPEYTNIDGERRSADGQYIPITLGVRF